MSGRTINDSGEIKVTTTDVTKVEEQQRTGEDVAVLILSELRKIKKGLSLSLGVDLDDLHEEE